MRDVGSNPSQTIFGLVARMVERTVSSVRLAVRFHPGPLISRESLDRNILRRDDEGADVLPLRLIKCVVSGAEV